MIEKMDPKTAFKTLNETPDALLIDVRDAVESKFVGYPQGSRNIPWKLAPDMRINEGFVAEVKALAGVNTPLFLLCRSGQRSMQAALRLESEGYRHLVNVEEGFEGDIDQNKQRGHLGGWRFHGLPWEQT